MKMTDAKIYIDRAEINKNVKTGNHIIGDAKDILTILNQQIEMQVSDEELEETRKAWVCPESRVKTGYLARYAKLVSSADKEAILTI